jgi:hypothetical protein
MSALEAAELTRLAEVLGMLGSIHAGQRDAAGLAAHRFVRERGLAWQQILCPPIEPQRGACITWRDTVSACLRHPGHLSAREADFLRGLPRFLRLSPKQATCLNRMLIACWGGRQHECHPPNRNVRPVCCRAGPRAAPSPVLQHVRSWS